MSRRCVVLIALMLLVGACGAPGGSVSGPIGAIDVGGRDLWIECLGQGSPVVVIESSSIVGTRAGTVGLAHALEDHTTVCRYDRAGKGNSDPAPRTSTTMASFVDDLAALLTAAELPGPYLLVGGALGAQIVLNYALTHDSQVAGMVILDTNLPSTDVTREPIAGLLSGQDRADYFRGSETARAWLAETESLLRPIPAVALRVLTATQFDVDCPAYWGTTICAEAADRHVAFQSDWLVVNPAAVLVEIDAQPGLAGQDEAVVREVVAMLTELRAAE